MNIAEKLEGLMRGVHDARTKEEDRITPEGLVALKKAMEMAAHKDTPSYQEVRHRAFVEMNKQAEIERVEVIKSGRQKRIDNLMKTAAIPKRFRGKVLADILAEPWGIAQKNLAEDLQTYLEEDFRQGKNAVIWGDKGTGKSQAVCALLGTLADMGEAVLYTRADKFAMQMESKAENVLETYTEASLVVIDELCSQDDDLKHYGTSKNKIQAGYVAQLVDSCYQEEVPVIIISNRTYDEIESFLGGPIIDRLEEDDSFIVKVTGPSLRTQKPDLRLVK